MQRYRFSRQMTAYPFPGGRTCALLLCVLLMPWAGVAHSGPLVSNHTGHPFSHEVVIQLARELAQTPFKEPPKAPESLTKLNKATYGQIEFQQNEAIWGRSPTRFSIQLFAPGFLFEDLVDIDVVENGRAYPVRVSESTFKVPDPVLARVLAQVGKYAGIRLHYPLNGDEREDEFIVFQGASYFRAVSKGQRYGLSARGLAIDVAQGKGEEQPLFRRFWIERPSLHHEAIVVHALLDSKSVSGAYRFGIYPGAPTRIDIDAILFPRRDIQHVGLAPLTSMFMHGPLDQPDVPDYRPAVHDSEALAMATGNGERLWRPLNNPRKLQISAFMDENPRGFGLVQRQRQFACYQDLGGQYERRPSAWVEPLGDWGKGQVELFEIPSDAEVNDNILAFWRPAQGLHKGRPHAYSYRLTWPNDAPPAAGGVRIVRSAGGRQMLADNKEIVIDYKNLEADEIKAIQVDASISEGRILGSRITPNPHIGGARVFVNFNPEKADVSELRVQLKTEDQPVAATWLYRWIGIDWP